MQTKQPLYQPNGKKKKEEKNKTFLHLGVPICCCCLSSTFVVLNFWWQKERNERTKKKMRESVEIFIEIVRLVSVLRFHATHTRARYTFFVIIYLQFSGQIRVRGPNENHFQATFSALSSSVGDRLREGVGLCHTRSGVCTFSDRSIGASNHFFSLSVFRFGLSPYQLHCKQSFFPDNAIDHIIIIYIFCRVQSAEHMRVLLLVRPSE